MMRQVRSDIRKQAKIKRHEKAVEIQMALEHRAMSWALEKELAELHRTSVRWTARFKVQERPETPERRTSPVVKRLVVTSNKARGRTATDRPGSSWVVDAMGMKGVTWQQKYLGRKSPGFHRGAARENWDYIVRDEAVLLDERGEPIIISNMGADWIEIGAGWQAMEDASTRANAKIQILAIAPFDSDMRQEEMVAALTHFCKTVLEPLDLPYSAAIHAPPAHGDARNFHPHIAFALRPMRRVEPYCWEVADDVCGELDGRDGVQMLRHLWAHSMSHAAEEAQSNRRYTGLGYGARRLDLETGQHLGEARAAIVARGGYVRAHERNRIKAERNAARRKICDLDRKIEALTKIRDAAVERANLTTDDVPPAKIFRVTPEAAKASIRPSAKTAKHRTTVRASSPIQPPVQRFSPAPKQPPRTFGTSARAVAQVETTTNGSPFAASPALNGTLPVFARRLFAASEVVAPPQKFREAARVRPASAFRPTTIATPAVVLGSSVDEAGLARTMNAARKPKPPAVFEVRTPVVPAPATDVSRLLLEALAFARSARSRKRRQSALRENLLLETLPNLDTRPVLQSLPILNELPGKAGSNSADGLDAEDRARITRLRALDPYVAKYGGSDGVLEIEPSALRAIGVDETWTKAPAVQHTLREMRRDQQKVLTDLARRAETQPLAFARHGTRFWPRDLDTEQLRRLDRWASDPGFEQDVFELQRAIRQAHAVRDAEQRKVQAPIRSYEPAPSEPDGFGGVRTGPAPRYQEDGIRARIDALDPVTGRPTRQLLELLVLVGRHSDRVVFASDGRLMGLPGKPAMLAPLMATWRNDAQVVALVIETVRASREAGRAIWPERVAKDIRAYTAGGARGADRNQWRHPFTDSLER